jgi:hypothetical protein
MMPATPIRVITDAETIDTTWGAFCADNLEGFDQDQLDVMAQDLRLRGETDISHLMHCGSRCVLTRVNQE